MAKMETILISGAVTGDLGELNDLFDAIYPTVQEVGSLEDALAHGRENLAATAKRVGKILAT